MCWTFTEWNMRPKKKSLCRYCWWFSPFCEHQIYLITFSFRNFFCSCSCWHNMRIQNLKFIILKFETKMFRVTHEDLRMEIKFLKASFSNKYLKLQHEIYAFWIIWDLFRSNLKLLWLHVEIPVRKCTSWR